MSNQLCSIQNIPTNLQLVLLRFIRLNLPSNTVELLYQWLRLPLQSQMSGLSISELIVQPIEFSLSILKGNGKYQKVCRMKYTDIDILLESRNIEGLLFLQFSVESGDCLMCSLRFRQKPFL